MLALIPLYRVEGHDWVIVQGDTTSAMLAAFAAHDAQIPVCHAEAGLRSGDRGHPWPEEANRRLIAALAQLHCAPTERAAAAALLSDNVASAGVHVTGTSGVDALMSMRQAGRAT